MTIEERLASALDQFGVRRTDALGVACSGGADSVALLHLLARLRPAGLHVLHVDHGLRDDSSLDAMFVCALAGELGLACTVRRPVVEVGGGVSLEAAARDARYTAMDEAAASAGLTWVATAHTLDDQAETALLRVMRGASSAGIAAVRGIYVRPLLDFGRAELRTWLAEHDLEWREDPTNADSRIERNWLRQEVMPLLASRRPGVTRSLARSASLARADAEVLDALAQDVFSRARVDDVGVLLSMEDLASVPEAVGNRVIAKALRELGAQPTAPMVDAISRLSEAPRGAVRSGEVEAHRIGEGLCVIRSASCAPQPVRITRELMSARWGFKARVGSHEADEWRWRTSLPSGRGLVIRARRPGDRVRTRGGTRKVQDVLVDAKVPRALRDLVPVVASAEGAVAVVGLTSWPGDRGGDGCLSLDVEPCGVSWSREVLWSRASC